MFLIVRKIRYQLRAGQRLYLAAFLGITIFYILFAFMRRYAENGEVVISRSLAMQLVGLFLPFFSVFLVLPVLNEIWSCDAGEILFAFRRALYKIIMINDFAYFIGVWGLFAIMVKIYPDILPCYINVFFACIYMQILVGFMMPFLGSDVLVIGILVFYLVYSMFCLSGIGGTYTGGYVAGIELEFAAFLRQQVWKVVCVVVIGVAARKNGRL